MYVVCGKGRKWLVPEDGENMCPKIASVSIIKTNQLMLYREIIAVCSEIHAEHVNTLWV
jgi:hypothetical protein